MKEKKHCTVLLVDDSPEDRHVFGHYLKQSADCIYTVLEAEDMRAGLRLCEQVRVDCVILDYELPDSTGLDFLDRIRDVDDNVSLPVVMVTGHGSEHIAVSAMKAGAIDYLVKDSVTPESLFRVTQNALSRLTTLNELMNQKRERKRVEGELKESECQFRLLVSSVSEYAIVMLGLDGSIATWNEGARKMLGYHDHDIIGQHFSCLYKATCDKQNAAQAHLARALADQRWESEQVLVRRDRAELHAVGIIAPLVDSLGQHRGYSWVVRDSTERNHRQQAAAKASQDTNSFLDKASHELRTPTTALLLNLEALQRQVQKLEGQSLPWVESRLSTANRLARNLAERIDALFPMADDRASPPGLRHE